MKLWPGAVMQGDDRETKGSRERTVENLGQ